MKAVLHVSTTRSCRRPGRTASFVLKALPAALAIAFMPVSWANPAINAGGAAGLPVNGVVRAGDGASGAVVGNQLTVTQTTDRAVIDWASFNIDAGKTVQFVQPSAGAVLNRVNAATNASQISGTLSANGMVMLMNPQGIVFNQGASVNVGALIATTGTIDENTFSKNGAQITGATAGSITNAGTITATAGANGLVAMVAPSVINQGVIAATGGSIGLLGSTAATISLNNGLYEFAIPGGSGATGAQVTNAAGAGLDAKTLYLGVGDVANLLSGTINLEGVQQASSAIVVNGDTVVLKSALQATNVSGNSSTVSVSGAARIQDGVKIVKSGGAVNVAAGTYSENVIINKALTLNGAGASQSIIKPNTGDAVTVSGNIGAGSSVLIDGFTFSGGNVAGSSGSGVKVASGTTLGQLTLQNSIFRDSGIFGFYAAGTSTAGLSGVGKVVLQDSSFTNNGNTAGEPTALGLGDIQFNYYNGDATLKNVHVTGTGEHTGIHFRGYHDAGGAVKNAGNVVFDNVVVDGTFRRPGGSVGTWNPDGPGYGIHFFEYDSVANVSFNDVKISNTVGHGLAVEGLGSTLDIGNTRFDLADTSVVGTGSNPTASLNIVTGGNSQNNVKTNVKATAASFTGAQNGFDIEDRVGHALDANGVGLVTWSAGNVYVTQKSASVQRGVDAATAGDTVNVGAGTFVENVTINKALTLDGAGSTQTVIKAPSSSSGTAVTINNASNVTLSDLQIADSFYGLQMSGTSNNVTVNRVAFNNNSYGVRNGTSVRADNFRMLNSTVTGGLVGVQAYNNASNTASFANALFENVTIDGPSYKGFYFETADNLTLRNVTILNTGNVGESTSHANGSAIDINLKYGAFNAITLDNVVVQNSGDSSNYVDRSAVVIKTRGVGSDTDYTATPASLQSLNIIGGSIEGSTGTALRLEDLGNASGGLTTVTISGGTQFKNNAKDIVVGKTNVDARGAVFVGASDGFAIEDRVTHALDTSGRGLVTWTAGNVYVTQNSGSIQRGVDVAAVGDTVNVANASFTENVTVNARRDLAFNDTRLQSLTLGSGAAGSGIGGAVTAEGAGGFNFDKDASIRLLSDTTLTTNGADIALKGDIQNGGGVARALRLVAGTGNVFMTTGGSEFASLGRFDLSANNFDLASTLWVSGYKIDAKGYVALSNSTLRAQDAGAVNTLNAGGDVTGATNSKGAVEIVSGGNIVAKITATELVAKAAGSIDAVLNVAKSAAFESGGATNVSGSAPVIAVNAPSGSVSGNFGTVNNTGTGLVNINGKPQGNTTLSSNTENNRVVPGGNLADGGGEGGGLQLAQAGGSLSANGSELSLSTPEAAGDAIDSGRSVELDMSPRKQRKQDKSADNSSENDEEKDKK